MRRTFIALSLLISTNLFASPVWKDISTNNQPVTKQLRGLATGISAPYSARLLRLDEQSLRQQLFANTTMQYAPTIEPLAARRDSKKNTIINLPLPDGSMLAVIATEYSMMEKALANKFPQLKTWKIKAANGKNIHGRIDFTEAGFHAMLTLENGDTIFIDPDKTNSLAHLAGSDNTQHLYNSFSKKKNKQLFQHATDFNEIFIQPSVKKKRTEKPLKIVSKISNKLITYRLAVAATAEYTALNGGTKISAFSAIVTTINRINEIYERDLAIRFRLIKNNDKIIYLDANSDPFSSGNPYDMLDENIANMEAVIGNDHYDLGHLFGGAGTGGLALLSGACRANYESHKAGGITGSSSPYGDSFNIDYVSHEIGHQLGATHTFNSIEKNCSGGNREADTAVEPGSGSTVMSYAGICGVDNLQHNSDAVFNAISIEQINQYVRYSGKANCGVKSASNNNSPSLNITTRFYIPVDTPFLLHSDATDIDGNDTLSYTWDQIDHNGTTVDDVRIDAGDNPLFRSYLPSASNQRFFPQLATLFGAPTIKGETTAKTNRNLTFANIVRDNNGGLARANIHISTSGKAFKITSQVSSYLYHRNEKIEVRWDEADTSWPPISCHYVDIKLITKDASTQDLLLHTPNDGSQFFTIPNTIKAVTNARIMVACSDNIFFALSQGHIAIDESTQVENTPIASINSPTIIEGDSGFKILRYIISLNKVATKQASIHYSIRDNKTNAIVENDIVTIKAGTTSAIIAQQIEGNTLIDGDRSYHLVLDSAKNVQLASEGQLTTNGTVIDNETTVTPINLRINDLSIVEGSTGITKAIFHLFLDQVANNDLFIKYTTLSDSAEAGKDFMSKSGRLSILAGETSATISIDIYADQQVEADESFWLVLSDPSRQIVLAKKKIKATIINDDLKIETPEEKVTDPVNKTAGSFDSILTFFLVYLSLLKLRLRART